MRFERTKPTYNSDDVPFSRSELNPKLSAKAAIDAGAFLGRLWALFGPASPRDGGFLYYLRDRTTRIPFTAYAGASGPGYVGSHEEHELRPVLEALECLLVSRRPADCEIAYKLDIEYGGAQCVIGCKNGRSFRRIRDTRTDPATAGTHAKCVAIAREYEGGYGALTGWQLCLERVLPRPPEEVTYRGRRYDNCCGFAIERAVPVMLYCHGESSPRGIPIAAIPFRTLPPVATLWLEAFDRWNKRSRTKKSKA